MDNKQITEHKPNFMGKIGFNGGSNGAFRYPCGLALGRTGLLYVADEFNHRVQCFEKGTFLTKWGETGHAQGKLNRPSSVTIGPCASINNKILMAITEIKELSEFPPGIIPICTGYVGEDHVYVCDSNNHRIQVFDWMGTFMFAWGSLGSEDGRFYTPYSCCMDNKGVIYVTETENNRIQVFTNNGLFIRKWGNREYNCPTGIATHNGLLYIIDSNNNRVVCCHNDGTHVSSWTTVMHPQIPSHHGIAITDGLVYVTHPRQHCVVQYRLDGTILKKWTNCKVHGDLNYPFAVAIDTNGVMYISDCFNHRIVMANIHDIV